MVSLNFFTIKLIDNRDLFNTQLFGLMQPNLYFPYTPVNLSMSPKTILVCRVFMIPYSQLKFLTFFYGCYPTPPTKLSLPHITNHYKAAKSSLLIRLSPQILRLALGPIAYYLWHFGSVTIF